MIALVKVHVKCPNDLGFVWSQVAWIPRRNQITVYFRQTTEQIICTTPFLSRKQKNTRRVKEQKCRHCHGTSAPPVRSVWHAVKGTWVDTCGKWVLCEVWCCTTPGLQPSRCAPTPLGGSSFAYTSFSQPGFVDPPPLSNCTPDFLYVYVG